MCPCLEEADGPAEKGAAETRQERQSLLLYIVMALYSYGPI